MAIILPGGENAPASGTTAQAVKPEIRDFGERLVQSISPVRSAAELCDVDCSIHDAVKSFEEFARDLTAQNPNFSEWPGRFAAEAKRIRDRYSRDISDGPGRERFDETFDLFAKAKAVETRGLATRKQVTTNRAELDRALAGYSQMISRATDPVSSDFALQQGLIAIRNQVDAKVLTEKEAEKLSGGFRIDIAEKRAVQFLRDDPDEAAKELAKANGGLFRDLPKDRRRYWADNARLASEATRADAQRAEEIRAGQTETAHLLRRDAFLTTLKDKTDKGLAARNDVADAVRDGILDPDDAERETEVLRAALDRRLEDADRVAGLLDDPNTFLDPSDRDDRRAADAHWDDLVQPLLDGLPAGQRMAAEDAVVARTGVVSGPLMLSVRAGLLHSDPAVQVSSAKRAVMWLLREPPIPVDLESRDMMRLDALRPYLDLPLDPGRVVELAEADMAERRGTAGAMRRAAGDIVESFDRNAAVATEDDKALGKLIVGLLPGVGEVLSAAEAEVAFTAARRLEREGRIGEATAENDRAMLATIGAIPVLGKLTKFPKAADAFWDFFQRYSAANKVSRAGGGVSAGPVSAAGSRTLVSGMENGVFSLKKSTNDSSSEAPEEGSERKSGKKRADNSNKEPHGDGGRTLKKIEADTWLREKEAAARKLPRKQRKKTLKKIQNIKKFGHKRRRGEEHSRRPKR